MYVGSLWNISAILIFTCCVSSSESTIKRCFSCRSRGDLGSCKDKFKFYNASQLELETGVEAVPCASGWCGKVIETSDHDLKAEEYGVATQRMCLQRAPSDSEQRCDNTLWGHKKVFMCFCQGDLCNSSVKAYNSLSIYQASLAVLVLSIYNHRTATL